MLSRALSLATVMLLAGYFAASPVRAQNLEAGKSPSQIFAGTCSLCHKSARGLLKTVPPATLPDFLRDHYTTSGEMASLLSAFLISNGANNTRYGGGPKPGNDAKPEVNPAALSDQADRPGRRLRPVELPQEAARPDVATPEGELSPQTPRQGRNARRSVRPGEGPDPTRPALDGQIPAQDVGERDPDGRRSAKQKLSKRSRPGDDAVKPDASKPEPPKGEAAKDDQPKDQPKSEAARDEASKPEVTKIEAAKPEIKVEPTKPSGEAAKVDIPKETEAPPSPRADPVRAVTPAPPAVSAGGSAPSAAAPPAPAPPPASPAVTASAPPPVVPAGPPVPPISQ